MNYSFSCFSINQTAKTDCIIKAVSIEKKEMSLIPRYKKKKIKYPTVVSIINIVVIIHDPSNNMPVKMTKPKLPTLVAI